MLTGCKRFPTCNEDKVCIPSRHIECFFQRYRIGQCSLPGSSVWQPLFSSSPLADRKAKTNLSYLPANFCLPIFLDFSLADWKFITAGSIMGNQNTGVVLFTQKCLVSMCTSRKQRSLPFCTATIPRCLRFNVLTSKVTLPIKNYRKYKCIKYTFFFLNLGIRSTGNYLQKIGRNFFHGHEWIEKHFYLILMKY